MSDTLFPLMYAYAEKATRLSMAAIHQFSLEHELSAPQLKALFFLQDSPQATINNVAGHFGFSKAAASQTIDRLVERGLVNRQIDPDDRRTKRLSLTAQGKDKVAQASQARRAWLHTLIDSFSAEEQAALQPAFQILLEGMNKVFSQSDNS
ncbi:MAG TPA: MarR family transcriptional regulator [Anaerolineaceae bacterium]|nr:MarR family transcriptional regulator [Anaerolineaceae bacterium]HQC21430.1 MarR family transcriptional regulator [Anaerolineaceae bacterium]